MARTIAQIQAAIVAAKNADATLSGLTSTSASAVWLAWTYVVAVCQWTLETLFDAHVAEVQALIAAGKPHTLNWYTLMAKAYQYGYELPVDAGGNATSDVYATIDPTAQCVTFAAGVELPTLNLVRIKTATGAAGSLAALIGLQLTGLTTYLNQVKDAGVRLQVTSGAGDNLQLALAVYYDPTVLDTTGARLDGTASTPVVDAINAFLGGLPFNGVMMLDLLREAILAVQGVTVVVMGTVQANYGSTPYVPITGQYVPDAGYLVLDAGYFNAHVNYNVYTIATI